MIDDAISCTVRDRVANYGLSVAIRYHYQGSYDSRYCRNSRIEFLCDRAVLLILQGAYAPMRMSVPSLLPCALISRCTVA